MLFLLSVLACDPSPRGGGPVFDCDPAFTVVRPDAVPGPVSVSAEQLIDQLNSQEFAVFAVADGGDDERTPLGGATLQVSMESQPATRLLHSSFDSGGCYGPPKLEVDFVGSIVTDEGATIPIEGSFEAAELGWTTFRWTGAGPNFTTPPSWLDLVLGDDESLVANLHGAPEQESLLLVLRLHRAGSNGTAGTFELTPR